MHCLTLIVHGGAGNLRPEIEQAARAGVERALATGWAILKAGAPAMDACEEAIIDSKNDPVFDAGVGAHLNRDGNAQLDAILMDGASLQSGAVGAVERIRNPIRLAAASLRRASTAFWWAQERSSLRSRTGMPLCDPTELVTPYERQRWAARAAESGPGGPLAPSRSTRREIFVQAQAPEEHSSSIRAAVGDSPLIGCGCYADNESAAVSCTGHGESIMKIVMAKTASDLVAAGHDAQAAADAAVKLLSRRTEGAGGLIIVDRAGRFGASFSTPHMTWAAKTTMG